MSAKHTPGPWVVYDDDGIASSNGHTLIVYASDSEQMGVCAGDSIAATAEANAKLIAAAPALADALEWAMRQIGTEPRRIRGQNDEYCNRFEAARDALRAAGRLGGEK